MGLLLAFMPDSFLVLFIVLIGFGIMLRIISLNTAFSLLGIIILIALLIPFVDSLFESLPLWLLLLLLIAFAFSILRGVLSLVFGRRATDEFVGHLMYDMFMLPFRFVGYLIRRRRIT